MEILAQIDWRAVFTPSINLFEIFVRGTITYLFLFLVLRILRRQAGTIGIADLLVVVMIADAAQNAMGSDYRSVTEGIVLVATIAGWDYFLDWLAFRFPPLQRVLSPPPLLLIRDGKIMRRSLQKEMITREELMSHLREAGVEDVSNVKKAYLEVDGRFSVITRESRSEKAKSPKKRI
jgi:uncharacterized membrane protein YcaP (DUF421 family)